MKFITGGPHCNGMGYAKPKAHVAMRGVKAEGDWAVVSTEEVALTRDFLRHGKWREPV